MTDEPLSQARLTLAAEFPVKSFLENLAIRADNSVLVSKMLEKEVWYVPPVGGNLPVEPTCILTYDQPTLGTSLSRQRSRCWHAEETGDMGGRVRAAARSSDRTGNLADVERETHLARKPSRALGRQPGRDAL
jgi:hypothetical protein